MQKDLEFCASNQTLNALCSSLTLEELHSAQEVEERDNNGDLAESLRRILVAAQKIDPAEKAGYMINDKEGIRYLEIDYNKGVGK
jgi:hypothetical protein